MVVFRITKSRHATDLSGEGAARYPGRWNKKGTPVLYTGESREIALLETLVHIPALIVPNLEILSIHIPDDSIAKIKVEELPKNWARYPAPSILAEIGQKWAAKNETVALQVPSSIIQTSNNFILNCSHPRFKSEVKIIEQKPFFIDSRLIK